MPASTEGPTALDREQRCALLVLCTIKQIPVSLLEDLKDPLSPPRGGGAFPWSSLPTPATGDASHRQMPAGLALTKRCQ